MGEWIFFFGHHFQVYVHIAVTTPHNDEPPLSHNHSHCSYWAVHTCVRIPGCAHMCTYTCWCAIWSFNIFKLLTFKVEVRRIVPEIRVGLTELCCWQTLWWWNLGTETRKSWHLIQSVFCNLFYCIQIVHFVGFLNIKYKKMQGMNYIKFSECGGIPCIHLDSVHAHSSFMLGFINCGILWSSVLWHPVV